MNPAAGAARLYRNACREARIALFVWFLSLLWTIGYCYLRGYTHSPDSWVVRVGLATQVSPDQLQTWLGFPDWLFFGILVPWVLCTLFTLAFALWMMADDDLGLEAEEGTDHAA